MRIFPLLFLCLPSLGVLAAEPQDTTAERMLNLKEVVVTATVPQIDVIPAQKLSGEELKRLNSNSVADALRYFWSPGEGLWGSGWHKDSKHPINGHQPHRCGL